MALTGGEKLQRHLKKITKELPATGTPYVKIGFLEGADYPDGTSLPMVAFVNEYGRPSKGQPPRPYFRNMITAKKGSWAAGIAAQFKLNDYRVEPTLRIVGLGVEKQLKQSILALVAPPLAASTIAAKGFDKPLIDTSWMINHTGSEVVMNEPQP